MRAHAKTGLLLVSVGLTIGTALAGPTTTPVPKPPPGPATKPRPTTPPAPRIPGPVVNSRAACTTVTKGQ